MILRTGNRLIEGKETQVYLIYLDTDRDIRNEINSLRRSYKHLFYSDSICGESGVYRTFVYTPAYFPNVQHIIDSLLSIEED